MCKYYSFPVLMIMNATISGSSHESNQIITQLYMLLKSFPSLKIIWCKNDRDVVDVLLDDHLMISIVV